MTSLRLSRLLYPKDELEAAFTTAILVGQTDEVIYWCAELHSSGWNPFHTIWHTYYNFYAVLNPHLAHYLSKKEHVYMTQHVLSACATAAKNLHLARWQLDTFLLKQLAIQSPPPAHVFRGRMPNWLSKLKTEGLDLSSCRVAQAILKGNWQDIVAYMSAAIKDGATFHNISSIVREAFRYKKREEVQQLPGLDIHKDNEEYRGTALVANIMYLTMTEKESCESRLYVPLTEEELGNWETYRTSLDGCEIACERYDILPRRIQYGMKGNILNSLELARHTLDPAFCDKAWQRYAESHCYETPYWRERIEKCNGVPSQETGYLTFDTDNNDERFYDTYWIHPDEQTDALRQTVMPPLDTKITGDWILHIVQSLYWCEGLIEHNEGIQWIANRRLTL
jgi:hypothetical protein